jgi:diguanylate cyclase (GGDEF)-like protein
MNSVASKASSEVLLEIIRTQTEIAKAGLDLGDVMDLVCQKSQILTGASGGVVELVEDGQMVYRAASGIAKPQLGLRLNKAGSLSGLCVEQRQILNCKDSDIDDRVDKDACSRVGLRSMIVVPLNHGDATVGVLKVVSSEVDAFTDADIEVLGLMSELIAAAMFFAVKLETNELYYRATHDSLTDLANRALFFDRLRQVFAQAQRHSYQFGILNLDMDGLKFINDHYGHKAGDAAIKEVARRINKCSRQSDTVARIGGDEFAIVLSKIDSRAGAEKQILRLAQEISQPFEFEQQPLALGASIGLAVFPDDGVQIDALLELADKKMYEEKRARKARN